MELQLVRSTNNSQMRITNQETVKTITPEITEDLFSPTIQEPVKNKRFIEANTEPVNLSHLKNDCIIPVFRDNEKTISHFEFIDTLDFCTKHFFKGSNVLNPEIRVSHKINGRIPQALHKKVSELEDWEMTKYYERMMFIIEIPSITEEVNGNRLNLTVGGVRALNHESLFSKKTIEKFKVFIGFQNLVCTNLLVSTDGIALEIRVSNLDDLIKKVFELFADYNMKNHLQSMRDFGQYQLTEHQFAQLIGKARLYPLFVSNIEKRHPSANL